MSALDERLTSLAVAPLADSSLRVLAPSAVAAASPAPTPAAAPRHWHRGWLPAAALASAAATAAVLIAATSPFTEAAQGLPILAAAPVDASVIRDQIRAPAERLDYARARSVATPAGLAYAVPSLDGRRICIAAPDPEAPGSYGTACGAVSGVERNGLILERAGDRSTDPRATSTITMVLPLGASGTQVRSAGRTWSPAVRAGVTSFDLQSPGTLTFRRRGAAVRHVFQGPFSAPSSYTVDCGSHSRTFKVLPTTPGDPGKPALLDRERACR